MYGKFAVVAVAAVLGSLALAPAAQAHSTFVTPRFGDPGDAFVFRGTAWQAFKRVRIAYDESADGSVEQTTSIFTNRFGNFRFTWRGENVEDTHRMCFRQYDSRRRFQRTFTSCRLFTLVGS